MKLLIEMTEEMRDEIVLAELKAQYELVLDDDPPHPDDKKYNKKLKKALELVLDYNMTSYDAKRYFDNV